MRYRIKIKGLSPLIMHNGAAGIDNRSPANIEKAEIASKRGKNRTEADDARLRELETFTSLWLDGGGAPTVPPAALRATIETGARKLKQGPQVREGLIVDRVESFDYDTSLGARLPMNCARRCSSRRASSCSATAFCGRGRSSTSGRLRSPWNADDELVDERQLAAWLDIAGRRIGLGDWRPEKSGHYGRFCMESIEEL